MSCESSKTPDKVSEHFWLGMQTKNVALVKKYSLTSSIDDSEELFPFEKISSSTFSKIIIDGDISQIETTVTTLVNEHEVDINLTTYLENHNEVWKVDYRKTAGQLAVEQNIAEVLGDIEKITEEMTAHIEESVEEIKENVVPEINAKVDDIQEKVVPEIKSQLEKAEKEIMEKIPQLKDIFDDFLHELEKSIEDLLPAEKEEEVKTQET
jgi:hypothetical protein